MSPFFIQSPKQLTLQMKAILQNDGAGGELFVYSFIC